MAPPRLPKDVADSLKERGYNVSRATSMKDFYAKLGLSSNPNDSAQIGFNDKLGHVQKEIKENRPVLPKKEVTDVIPFAEIMESMPKPEGYKHKHTENDFKILTKLEARYGDDYEMMSYDRRRNPKQWTVAQLKREFDIYHREVKEIEEEQKQIEEARLKAEQEAAKEEEDNGEEEE